MELVVIWSKASCWKFPLRVSSHIQNVYKTWKTPTGDLKIPWHSIIGKIQYDPIKDAQLGRVYFHLNHLSNCNYQVVLLFAFLYCRSWKRCILHENQDRWAVGLTGMSCFTFSRGPRQLLTRWLYKQTWTLFTAFTRFRGRNLIRQSGETQSDWAKFLPRISQQNKGMGTQCQGWRSLHMSKIST